MDPTMTKHTQIDEQVWAELGYGVLYQDFYDQIGRRLWQDLLHKTQYTLAETLQKQFELAIIKYMRDCH